MDGDGDVDLLLLTGETNPQQQHPAGFLFRQDAPGKFVDVTATSGLKSFASYIHGAAAADFDNDGDVDLYLTGYGGGQLFTNNGKGVFTPVDLGVRHRGWGVAAAWADVNRDGWLDLIVGNYVRWNPARKCKDYAGREDFCGPKDFEGDQTHLYLNQGGKRFEDVTIRSGLVAKAGKALGLTVRDFDGDGRIDILVANDGMENFLWMQQPDGTFKDEAFVRGIALDEAGGMMANMGVACEDFDRDGFFDILITHLKRESATLWRGLAHGQFVDATAKARLKLPSMNSTGWGIGAADLDLDGNLDLLFANGHVARNGDGARTPGNFWRDYADSNQLLLATAPGVFRHAVAEAGPFGRNPEVSRALALADFDRDGDLDFVVSNIAGPARIYENVFARRGHWLRVRAFDPALHRDALGARISVRAGNQWYVREILTHTSYLSSHEPIAHFGIPADAYQEIVVQWPNGSTMRERFPGGKTDQLLTLKRGAGSR